MNMNDISVDNGASEELEQDNGDLGLDRAPSAARSANQAPTQVGPALSQLRLPSQRRPFWQAIALTCAVELTDELDLDLMQLEWWQIERPPTRHRLLWRSTSSSNQAACHRQAAQTKHSPKFTVIDYVTRANRSGDSLADVGDPLQPARLVHLILAGLGKPASRQYVCRVTNQSGRLELMHPIEMALEPARSNAPLADGSSAARLRAQMRNDSGSSHLNDAKVTLKAAIASESTESGPGWPKFQPICLAVLQFDRADALEDTEHQPRAIGLNARPASARQSAPTGANATVSIVHLDGAANTPEAELQMAELSELAVHLIASYVSNRRSLIEHLLEEPSGERRTTGAPEEDGRIIASFAEQLASVRSRYLDKWIRLAQDSHLSLLVAVLSGLLLGSLLTVLVVVRFRCGRARRVADLDGRKHPQEESPTPNRLASSETSAESTANGSERKLIESSCSPSSGSDPVPLLEETSQNLRKSSNLWQVDSSTCQSADDEAEVDDHMGLFCLREDCSSSASQQRVGARHYQNLLISGRCLPETCSKDNGSQAHEDIRMQVGQHPLSRASDYELVARNQGACSHICLDPANIELDLALISGQAAPTSFELPLSQESAYQQVVGTNQARLATLPATQPYHDASEDPPSDAFLMPPSHCARRHLIAPRPHPKLLKTYDPYGSGKPNLRPTSNHSGSSSLESPPRLHVRWMPTPETSALYTPNCYQEEANLTATRPTSSSSFVSTSPSLTNISLRTQPTSNERFVQTDPMGHANLDESKGRQGKQNVLYLDDAMKLLDNSVNSCFYVLDKYQDKS